MTGIGQLSWHDGMLRAESPGCPPRDWTRPADLAAARLGTDPAPASLECADGHALLSAAFTVVPFARGPLPAPTFGDAVTPAAQAAFNLFIGSDGAGDSFLVFRGEPDDFLVFARRFGAIWRVGAFTVEATTLTLRFEDVWDRTPHELRATSYKVDVLQDSDPVALQDVAPDARIFIDLAANGGFLMTFTPNPADA